MGESEHCACRSLSNLVEERLVTEESGVLRSVNAERRKNIPVDVLTSPVTGYLRPYIPGRVVPGRVVPWRVAHTECRW